MTSGQCARYARCFREASLSTLVSVFALASACACVFTFKQAWLLHRAQALNERPRSDYGRSVAHIRLGLSFVDCCLKLNRFSRGYWSHSSRLIGLQSFSLTFVLASLN